jgi:histone deacetylase 6
MDSMEPAENQSSGSVADLPMDVDVDDIELPVVVPTVTLDPQRATSLPPRFDQFTVGYVYAAEMMEHLSMHGHPEKPERIARILSAIVAEHLHTRMKRIPIRPVKREEALLVHSEDHWDKVIAIKCESWFSEMLKR